ncbi:hypothetical protein [Terriglobus aquaticus]|uniref:Uncharacterized protein n=1 Tax=Terriglobus aquaticus TaxID=940139 RepID=A0ABW9KNY3_9BACT|nr:hypothetical protein [Terriglobus aquaticus]
MTSEAVGLVNSARAEPLGVALRRILRDPLLLLRGWNWKTAAFSALMRGVMFLLINLRAGQGKAVRAMVVEALYAISISGLAGALTQRLRHAEPRRLTAVVVLLFIPLLVLTGEALVHAATGTPRLARSMAGSFLFAALGSGFNWFAMSRGAFVTGEGRSFGRDLLLVPKLIWEFVTLPLREVRRG